jgi:predicted PurR-regulated permease PerM
VIENLPKIRRNLALAVIAALVIWFSWTVRTVLNPVVLGYIFASTLHPGVQRLEKRGWSRRAAVNLIFASFSVVLLSVCLGLYVQGRMMARDVFETNVDLPGSIEKSFDNFVEDHKSMFSMLLPEEERLLEGGSGATTATGGDASVSSSDPSDPSDSSPASAAPVAGQEGSDPHYLNDLLRTGWQALSGEQAGAGKMALRGAGSAWKLVHDWFGSVLGFLSLILLLPIYTWFLLFQLETIRAFFRRYLPVHERERVSHVAGEIGEVLASFFRGRLLICVLKGAVLTIGLWIVGVPYAFLLGMGSGFLSLVPFVGSLLGFLVAFSMGLLPADSEFLGTLIRTGIVFGLGEMIEGYVLVPKILGNSLGLHPVVVMVSVFAGGAALGMFGLLIAIPLTASLVIVTRELVLPALAQFADEDGEDLANDDGNAATPGDGVTEGPSASS